MGAQMSERTKTRVAGFLSPTCIVGLAKLEKMSRPPLRASPPASLSVWSAGRASKLLGPRAWRRRSPSDLAPARPPARLVCAARVRPAVRQKRGEPIVLVGRRETADDDDDDAARSRRPPVSAGENTRAQWPGPKQRGSFSLSSGQRPRRARAAAPARNCSPLAGPKSAAKLALLLNQMNCRRCLGHL